MSNPKLTNIEVLQSKNNENKFNRKGNIKSS